MILLYILLFLGLPAAVLWLVQRYGWARRIGAILLCYLAGLILGNSGLLPDSAAAVQTQITEAAIALALPMLLFTLDVRAWRRIAGRALLSMLLATVAVTAVAVALFTLFRQAGVVNPHELAGLTVGIYTGGTPNLAAIKTGLQVEESRYLLFHTFDVLLGGLYLLFMLSIAPWLFRRLLPYVAPAAAATAAASAADDEDYRPLLQRRSWPGIALAFGLSVLIVAVSLALGNLLPVGNQTALVILLLTSFGILASLFDRVRRLPHAYQAGMYLIYVFSVTVASMARFTQLQDVDFTPLLFLAGALVGSLCLHALLCRLFRIDADTFMVTSVAAICSPPFVPMIAKALGNPAVLLSGITAGIIGYAIGNYLGISLGLLLS